MTPQTALAIGAVTGVGLGILTALWPHAAAPQQEPHAVLATPQTAARVRPAQSAPGPISGAAPRAVTAQGDEPRVPLRQSDSRADPSDGVALRARLAQDFPHAIATDVRCAPPPCIAVMAHHADRSATRLEVTGRLQDIRPVVHVRQSGGVWNDAVTADAQPVTITTAILSARELTADELGFAWERSTLETMMLSPQWQADGAQP